MCHAPSAEVESSNEGAAPLGREAEKGTFVGSSVSTKIFTYINNAASQGHAAVLEYQQIKTQIEKGKELAMIDTRFYIHFGHMIIFFLPFQHFQRKNITNIVKKHRKTAATTCHS